MKNCLYFGIQLQSLPISSYDSVRPLWNYHFLISSSQMIDTVDKIPQLWQFLWHLLCPRPIITSWIRSLKYQQLLPKLCEKDDLVLMLIIFLAKFLVSVHANYLLLQVFSLSCHKQLSYFVECLDGFNWSVKYHLQNKSSYDNAPHPPEYQF